MHPGNGRQRQHQRIAGPRATPTSTMVATCASAGSCTMATPPARATAARPGGAVLVGAGQQDRGQPRAIDIDRRLEQHVDRRPRKVDEVVGRQRELRPVIDQQVIVGRREVDRARARSAPCPRPRAPAAAHLGWKISGKQAAADRAAGAGRRRSAPTRPAAPAGSRRAPPRRRPTRRSRRHRRGRATSRRSRRLPLLVDAIARARRRRTRRHDAENRSDLARADAEEAAAAQAPRGTGRWHGPAARDRSRSTRCGS